MAGWWARVVLPAGNGLTGGGPQDAAKGVPLAVAGQAVDDRTMEQVV